MPLIAQVGKQLDDRVTFNRMCPNEIRDGASRLHPTGYGETGFGVQ